MKTATYSGSWVHRGAFLALIALSGTARAQQGSSGNTYIFGGAQMTFFGAHDFGNGGSGALPGIIGTVRSDPNGVLNFTETASHTGASDAAHVDGYVRKYGTSLFVFPVGDNGFYGPFAAAADATHGAYYHSDPTSAITDDLGGGNYPVLPAGGPFPSATFDGTLQAVSTIEYWDINGTNSTAITLTWDAGSNVTGLTGAQLDKLTIAGWNGSQWVPISSKVDATSILGGASSLTAGSITTLSPLVPDAYTAYTLASRVTPLPVTLASFDAKPEGQTALLTWVTTEEINSDRFEIERSIDGKAWAVAGTVKATGESVVRKEYNFTDAQPSGGRNFYRLNMIDRDGTHAYSRIRLVEWHGAGQWVFPNPASGPVYVSNPSGITRVMLTDLSGRLHQDVKVAADGELDIKNVPGGTYLLKVARKDGTEATSRFFLRK
ncbi:T9SS type A sorting domain-containing protein [Dyadobacter sp. OTU695]|uniref:T9SS type A sorting domain-containing protein n=1 Tax=Dyadobacter sp. OTU695 TaxID=3043860 RepID=UPI00313A9C09